ALRRLSHGWTRSAKKRLANRPKRWPFLEPLEDRLLLGSGQLALLFPAYPTGQSPFGAGAADVPTAEVSALYRVVLGREPNAAGQNYWTALLQSGTNLANVVNAFFKSTEFTTTFVESYYATLFGRPADQAGLSYWTGVWARSGDTNALIAGFTSSSEYA